MLLSTASHRSHRHQKRLNCNKSITLTREASACATKRSKITHARNRHKGKRTRELPQLALVEAINVFIPAEQSRVRGGTTWLTATTARTIATAPALFKNASLRGFNFVRRISGGGGGSPGFGGCDARLLASLFNLRVVFFTTSQERRCLWFVNFDWAKESLLSNFV